MELLISLFNLITSDMLTFGATAVLVLAVLALLVIMAWPARPETSHSRHATRSTEARAMVASGKTALEIARQTGLSRDALALMMRSASSGERQKAPSAARFSFLSRFRAPAASQVSRGQVIV